MLKKIGFTYSNQVDPFDGGPHLRAKVDDLVPVQAIARGTVEFVDELSGDEVAGLVCWGGVGGGSKDF